MSGKTFLDTNIVVYLYSGDDTQSVWEMIAMPTPFVHAA